MALTKISTGGVKDDAASQAKIADEAVDEARLQISNAGSNGQFLSKQSGNTGGLTWATPPDTNTQVGGATGVDFDDNVKARFGTGNDLEIYHDSSQSYIHDNGTGGINLKGSFVKGLNGSNEVLFNAIADQGVELYYNNTKKIETTADGVTVTGTVSDSKGNLRSIPQNTQGSSYTLVAADAGKHILASGTITVPDSVFSAGDAVTIVNNTGGDLTITKTITTMYLGTDASSANRTLATRGMATILFASGTVAYISGAGLS